MIEGWDNEAEGSGGHWAGLTHGGIRCLSRGHRSLAAPPDLHAANGAVLASMPRLYATWYAVFPAPGSPQPPPQHQYPYAGDEAILRAWLAARSLVRVWRHRHRV